MHFLPLTFLSCLLIVTSGVPSVDYAPASPKRKVEPALSNILLQSKDGGRTWQDISQTLPETVQPEDLLCICVFKMRYTTARVLLKPLFGRR